MHYASDQQNPVVSCSAIIDKASQIYNISKTELGGQSITQVSEVSKRLVTLSKAATSIMITTMLDRKVNASWLLDFLKVGGNIQAELLKNPKIAEHVTMAIWEAGPNFLVDPDTGKTLLIRLAFDDEPEIRKFTYKLLNHKDLDLKKSTSSGNTALHGAARNNDADLIKALVTHGADSFQSNKRSEIPFEVSGGPESRNEFLKTIPLTTLVNGELFANRVVRGLCRRYYSSSSLDLSPISEYLRMHKENEEIRKCLSENFNIDLVFRLLEHGYLVEGLLQKDFVAVCCHCIEQENVDRLRTIVNSRCLPFEPVLNKDIFSAIESNRNLAASLTNELKEAKNALGEEALAAYQSLVRNLVPGWDNIHQAVRMDEIDCDFNALIQLQVPGAKKAKVDFDANECNRTQRDNLAKARQIFNQPGGAKEKVLAAIPHGQEVLRVLKELAWVEKDNKLLSEIERIFACVGYGISDKFGEETSAMNAIIANVALDKCIIVEKKVMLLRGEDGLHLILLLLCS